MRRVHWGVVVREGEEGLDVVLGGAQSQSPSEKHVRGSLGPWP